MTQPLDIQALARETAEDEIDQYFARLRNQPGAAPIGDGTLAALTKLAAEKDAEIVRHKAALKVATDALQYMASDDPPCDNDGQGCGCCEHFAPTALTQIEKELKP